MSVADGVPRVTLADQITALQHAPIAELVARFVALFGHPPRTRRNAAWLRKRIAFKLQENAFGGLSRVARSALDRLTGDIALTAAAPPTVATPAPTPGSGHVLQREWRGQTVRVVSTADGGFEWNGERYGSLSAVAFAITGSKWNGKLFFGLTGRKRR
jgi:hypothetical protein